MMSKQLKSKPLSSAKIASILGQNPSMKINPSSPLPVAIQPQIPPTVTLKRKQEYDSLKPEETLRDFLSFSRNVISRYEENQRRQADLETETQDMLHYIELSPNMNACEYTKHCIKLREIRRQRRACKSENDLLRPLYEYLSDKTLINKLSQIQGQCRTSKEAIDLRSYTLRTDVVE